MILANVGSFGDITFYCKSVGGRDKILSFHDLNRSSSASFSEHERNGEKAYLEFGGDGLDEITLTVEADARYGVRPLEIQDKLYEKKSLGKAEFFVLGGKKVGKNPFVITNISETFTTLYIDGRVIAISLQLTLREYANRVATITTIPSDMDRKPKEAAVTGNDSYIVVKGDCLWNIAKKFYGKGSQYTLIYNANRDKIKNPNLIYPGQILIIPK